VLKVFAGYRGCTSQPDGWHQYAPAVAADAQGSFSYSISPGFYHAAGALCLGRDLARWRQNIRDMVASGAAFQLVTTFNEWGEGTAVESASEWSSVSGYGAYLDALHNNGLDSQPQHPTASATPTNTPAPATPTNTPAPPGQPSTATLTITAVADARVAEANPSTNYGTSRSLRVDGAGDPDVETYLRFTVTGVSGTVQSARLRLYATVRTTNGPLAYAASDNWSETGITWNNRPARISSATDNRGAIGANMWVEFDVTPLVTGNATYSFALVPDSSDGINFSSRQGSYPPQLVLTLAGGSLIDNSG
jgi:hypothetical protein